MKKSYLINIIILILMLLLTSFTYAWNAFVESRHVGKFESEKLIYELKVNGNTTNDLPLSLKDIVYVDYLKDFKDNFNGENKTTNTLTHITKSVKFVIENDENSISVGNILEVSEKANQVGLYYFIIIEGVFANTNLISWTTNYTDFIKGSDGILKDASTKTLGITAMNNYNSNQINAFSLLRLAPKEVLAFQIIFYADHDLVVGGNNSYDYLKHQFELNVKVNTIQKEGMGQ